MGKKKVYKILVVDDDPHLLDLTVRILKKTEHKVFTAINGTECMQLLKKEKPEIIVLDFMLSDPKGKDIFKRIKSDPEFSSVYIILLSELKSHENDVSDSLEEGADGFITKPVDSHELLAHVKSAVRLISAEERVIKDEMLLKACFDSPKDMIVLAIDLKFNYLAFNTYHKAIMIQAYGKEIEIGRNILDCITNKEDIRKARINYGRALAGESHMAVEEYGELDRQYYETRYNPIYDEKNKIIGATAFSSSITKRKNMEDSLRKSEEKFRKAFNTSPDAININRLSDGMYVSINEGFTKITGYTNDFILGKSSLELNIWNDPSDRDKLIKGLREKGNVENLEATFRCSNGDVKSGIMSASVLDLDGVPHILSITRDITERKLMEIALKESEIRFRKLVELAPDGILLGSNEGIITGANTKMLKISGRKTAELIGQNINLLFSGEELKKIPLRYDLLKEEVTLTNQRTILRPDGTTVPIEMHTRMMPDGSYQSIIHDISERKKAEEELIENERLLRESQNIARLGSFVWDIPGGLWKSSTILDEIFGIDKKYLRSLDGWVNLVHPEWRTIMIDYVSNEVIGKHKKFDKEYQIIRHNDGAVRWVHGLSELEFDKNNQPVKLIGTIIDITGIKQVEESLNRKIDELEFLNDMMVNREIKMVDLKKEINDLLNKMGEGDKYIIHKKED